MIAYYLLTLTRLLVAGLYFAVTLSPNFQPSLFKLPKLNVFSVPAAFLMLTAVVVRLLIVPANSAAAGAGAVAVAVGAVGAVGAVVAVTAVEVVTVVVVFFVAAGLVLAAGAVVVVALATTDTLMAATTAIIVFFIGETPPLWGLDR